MTSEQNTVDMGLLIREVLETYKKVYEGNKVFTASATDFVMARCLTLKMLLTCRIGCKMSTQQRDAKRGVN